jgi:hypothetical protein
VIPLLRVEGKRALNAHAEGPNKRRPLPSVTQLLENYKVSTISIPWSVCTAIPSPIEANYAGPIRKHIVNMSTDKIIFMVFPYSKNKQVRNYSIRCDVEKVPPSALWPEIKQVSTAVHLTLSPDDRSYITDLPDGWCNHPRGA